MTAGQRSAAPKQWLRLRHFALAPDQRVLRPAIASTLFPQLTRPARRRFEAILVLMLAGIGVLAVLRVTPALIAVGALGVPLLFVLYLNDVGAFGDVTTRLPLAVSAGMGAALGVAGTLLTARVVARSYDLLLLAGLDTPQFVPITVGVLAASLQLLPAVTAWILSKPPRKSLDGFAVGALGSLTFGAAATLTRLAPQFADGVIARTRSVSGLMIEAAISAITVPLTAAAAGGTVGVALWFAPAPEVVPAVRRRTRAALGALVIAVVAIFASTVVTDIAGFTELKVLALHLSLTVAAVICVRLALQIAFLGRSVLSSWRPSKNERLTRLLAAWTLGNAVLAASLVVLSVTVTVTPALVDCPPDCGRPPISTTFPHLPRYTANDGKFSVAYPAAGSAYDITTDATGVSAKLTIGDGGLLQLFGEPADGRTPRDVVAALLKKKFPNATVAYEIPNAMVGYQPGYGVAADRWPQGSTATYLRLRLVLLVAVKNDVALVAAAAGPFHEFSRQFGPGPPSGANLQIAEDMGKYVNSFRWKGDPLD